MSRKKNRGRTGGTGTEEELRAEELRTGRTGVSRIMQFVSGAIAPWT
jgi:hypothetical protein